MGQLADELSQILETSQQDVNHTVEGLSPERMGIAPDPGRWSVLECMEHIVTVEERFLHRLRQADRLTEPRMEPGREAELTRRARDRGERREAPEAALPRGRFATVAEALQAFNAVRQETTTFAQEQSDTLYLLSIEHPKFGVMNGVEVLRLIAAHAERHAEQIREVAGSSGN